MFNSSRLSPSWSWCLLAVATVISSGCPSSDPQLVVASGQNQSGTVGQPLSQPIRVKVLAKGGSPASGVTVSFVPAEGQGAVSAASVETDADGIAQSVWTLGTAPGPQRLTVSASLDTGALPPLVVEATAVPGPPSTITVSMERPTLQFWADTTVAAAIVADALGNVLDLPVAWSSSDGAIAAVDATGRVTSGRGGAAILTATTGGLTGSAEVNVAAPSVSNAACPPSSIPTPGTISAQVPTFTSVDLFDGPGLRYGIPEFLAVDLDADDIDEVVVFNSNFAHQPEDVQGGEVRVWKLQGDRYVDQTSTVLPSGPLVADHTRAYAVADFDGNGRPDIFAGQHGFDGPPFPGAPNFLLLSQADGTLVNVAPTAMQPFEANTYTHGLAAADVNCDGTVDLFEANLNSPNTPDPHLFINSGAAQFTAEDARIFAIQGGTPLPTYTSAEFCDLDRDGDADLLLGGWTPWEVFPDELLVNDGAGNFRAAAQGTLPVGRFGADGTTTLEMRCVDVDQDGWNDIFGSATSKGYTAGSLFLWRNNGDGTFSDLTEAAIPNAGRSTEWLARLHVVDFNRDGWPDLHASGLPSNGAPPTDAAVADVYMNTGGQFAYSRPAIQYVAFSVPVRTVASGRTDLVYLNYGPGENTVPRLMRSDLP